MNSLFYLKIYLDCIFIFNLVADLRVVVNPLKML